LRYAGLVTFLFLITSIVPAFALYEPPTTEEKNIFDQLLSQFEVVDAPKKDVSDIIESFQKPVVNTFSCISHDVNNQVVTTVSTKLAKFDENTVHQDLVTGGSYTWHCLETAQNEQITLECTNELRINPKVITNNTKMDPKLANIENLVILYHELLHGQLMIDAIKSSILWQQEVCNKQPEENIDYSYADPDHKIINYMQTQFASELADKEGGKLITKEISPDETKNGTFSIKMLSFTDYPSYKNGSKITLRTNNISENLFFQDKNDVFLSGKLKDNTKPGTAWVYLFNNGLIQNMTQESIPSWAKRIAGLWSNENVQDKDFYSMIDYLVEHNIIRSDSEKNTVTKIPHWVKKNAQLWFTGNIDDNTFLSSIQYLFSVGLIS